MAAITIRDVKKSYAKTQVVHGVDLDIASGEFVVILGPSGCGKSTLLRMIAGLEEITGGEIAIDGTVVNKLEPRERGCAMVFQNYALYPHMSVAREHRLCAEGRRRAQGRARRSASQEVARIAGARASARPQARATFRRPAPARRHGPRHDPRAEGVPVRRAALQSRRQAARRRCAAEIRKPAPPAGATSRLRHPRPGRGDDAGRPAGGDEWRHGSSRSARRPRSTPSAAASSPIHRLAGDELCRDGES